MVYDELYGTVHEEYTCPKCGAVYELEVNELNWCPRCGLSYEECEGGIYSDGNLKKMEKR